MWKRNSGAGEIISPKKLKSALDGDFPQIDKPKTEDNISKSMRQL